MKKVLLFVSFLILFQIVFGQSAFRFEQNKGQWNENVRYRVRLNKGFLYLQERSLLFVYGDKRKHSFLIEPLGMRLSELTEGDVLQGYSNYFIGNDESKWKTGVKSYGYVLYRDVYEGIDWKIYGAETGIKHEFVLSAGADYKNIRLRYEGLDKLELDSERGCLVLHTCLGRMEELKPYAYQLIDGKTVEVEARFVLKDGEVCYDLGTYDSTKALVVDPTLVFSTYSGSTSDNWGFTATYDSDGNMYTGSIVRGDGYPTSVGAFDDDFGGEWDCAVSKFNSAGTDLIFSTYFGGNQSEMPHSMTVNQFGELLVFGTTGSSNFPTTSNAFGVMFSGGSTVTYDGTIVFPFGVDIFVNRFSSDGTQLLASTFVGGSGNDGLNYRERYNSEQSTVYLGNDTLYANYGDGARGEIITDDRNNVYVGSSTFSDDFPVTDNAFQNQFGGGQEGVVFKLDYSLSSMLFGSYIGGSGDDAVFSVDTDSEYRLYVTGGTSSIDFPTCAQAYNTTSNFGTTDAFVSLVSYDGSQLLASTYFGSDTFDLSYFVRTDRNDNPHIFGQTKASGSTLVYNTQYSIPNSGQFIAKFTPMLDSLIWSTVFGTGDGRINISPTAFVVDVCGRVYLSGWGRMFKYMTLPNSTNFGTYNMQLSGDAYQTQTDGQDFYLMAMTSDASALDYATFFGEVSSSQYVGTDHVDGGTSRFDKFSNLYQVVCASCGGSQGFPVFPDNVWSSQNNSSNCNMAAFKFNIHDDFAVADFKIPDYVCYPQQAEFENTGRGDSFYWDFGDGGFSVEENPVYTYENAGIYDVTLIAYKQDGCVTSDTLVKQIIILDSQSDTIDTVSACPNDYVQIGLDIFPSSDVTFLWQPGIGLTDSTAPNPHALVTEDREYRLIIHTEECSDTVIQRIEVRYLEMELQDTINYCSNPYVINSNEINPSAEVCASWSRDFADTIFSDNGIFTLENYTSRWLYLFAREGNCFGKDSVFMNYEGGILGLEPHQTRCNNESNGYVTATTDGFAEPVFFQWSNGQSGEGLDSIGDLSVGNYTLTITDANGCTATQEFEISSPSDLDVDFQKTDNPCQGVCTATITLNPTGGVAPYAIEWQDGSTGLSLSGLCTGVYVYELTDAQGCKYNDTIDILQLDTVRLNVAYGENLCPEGCSATAEAVVSGGTFPYSYQWSNGENAAMLTDLCSGDYSLQVTDANGCKCEESFSITYTDVFEDFWVSASQDRVYDGQVVTLSSKHIPQMNYSWYPSENLVAPHSSSTDALMYESTMFYVYVTDNKGCDLKDSVFVHVDVVNCGKPNIYVPNIFTPNGDGKNDAVFVKGDWIDSFIFEIYDRWGEKVFSTNRLDEGWDGTYKGNRCDAAVYYYRLEVKCQGGKTYTGSGDITLIR